jgi:hypothetical protein
VGLERKVLLPGQEVYLKLAVGPEGHLYNIYMYIILI